MTDPHGNGTFLVLVVGDEPGAVRLIEEAFSETDRPTKYVVADDEAEAFDVLWGRGGHTGTHRPDLVLLDLEQPDSDGQRLLAELRTHPDLYSIPVVVLSGTDDTDAVAECYRLGANAFIEKPMDYDGMLFIVRSLIDVWGGGRSPG